jgi:hypothetical protein
MMFVAAPVITQGIKYRDVVVVETPWTSWKLSSQTPHNENSQERRKREQGGIVREGGEILNPIESCPSEKNSDTYRGKRFILPHVKWHDTRLPGLLQSSFPVQKCRK